MGPRPVKRSDPGSIDVRVLVSAGISRQSIISWAVEDRQKLPARPGQLSVAVVGLAAMKKLNCQWRGHQRATNVLSFLFPKIGRRDPEQPWGEIVLCPPVIRRQAEQLNQSYRTYFRFLLQHGMIHLIGLDHQTPAEQRRWEQYQRRFGL